MLSGIANYLARRKLARLNDNRKKQFVNWDQVEKLALVIDQSFNPGKGKVDEFVSSLNKYTEVFLIDTGTKQPRYGDWICFTRTDKNLLGLPKNKTLAVFNGRKYDAVICICNREDLFKASLVGNIEVVCRSGNTDVMGEMDLIIDKRDDQDIFFYLKEVIRYFEMIRSTG